MSKDKDNTKARCTCCRKTIELASSGRSALTDHARGKRHIAIVDKRKKLFKPKSKPSTEESTESSGETIVSNVQSQKTLEMHFHNADCIKADIIWTLKSVLGGFSVHANDDLNETLSAMFPGSKIARNFSMARTKTLYVINHGIVPYFKSLLLSSINTSDIHVYSFVESLNEVTQTCEMDLYVQYCDVACSQVKMRYFGSSLMGHGIYTVYYNILTK